MLAEQLEFEFLFECSDIEAEYYREGAQDLIKRLVPADLLEVKGMRLSMQRARFAELLPMIVWSDLSKAPCTLSVLLLCKYRLNACNFFYDMIGRWLLPHKRVNVELFFASDVRLPHLSDELLSVAEVVIHLKSAQDVEEVRRNLHVIETEVRLGVASNYHARRILEFKGLSMDGKTAMIQEKIGSLIQSHSKDFDRGIFMQMQQFLVTCREEFKAGRDYHHMSRIISNLYSIRKVLKQHVEMSCPKRQVMLKFFKTRLAACKNFPERPVLGILAGITFFEAQERFEIEHFINTIQKHLPDVNLVADSPFAEREGGGSVQMLYLEVAKDERVDFTLDEIQLLKSVLPEQIKNGVERFARPIFMPRNEEEVLRNIMTLSRQLRYINDLPQIILSLDEQQGNDLCFTVILARIIAEGASSLQQLFESAQADMQIFFERIRRVGLLRRKYIKEASVMRVIMPNRAFLREDRSIDFYKVRNFILNEVVRVIGDVRDFNGGMIHKQSELLAAFKVALGPICEAHVLLIEKFFYSLLPTEMRTILDVDPLKHFFLLFLQVRKTDLLQKKQDGKRAMIATPLYDRCMEERFFNSIKTFSVPMHQLVSFQMEVDNARYGGFLLLSEDKQLQARFLSFFVTNEFQDKH